MIWRKASWFGGVVLMLAVVCFPHCSAASDARSFLAKYCFECHDADTKKGGLDLVSMPVELTNHQNFARWVKIYDRAASGEMPPKKKPRPAASDLAAFTNSLAAILLKTDRERIAAEGRATQRRLNRYEYEDTLGDLLLLPSLEVKSFLPEDSEANGFNKCGTPWMFRTCKWRDT